MLSELCSETRNYFCGDADKHFGVFEISGGGIAPLDFLQDGQYFRIIGSAFNDGVHQYPAYDLTDETFSGAVWAMRVPPDFLRLSEEIREYNQSDAAKASPFTSESFGGYSYTRVAAADTAWQTAFADRLRPYRRLRA